MGNSSQRAFAVFNPKAGKEGQADEVRAALARHFIPLEIHLVPKAIHVITPKPASV